MKKLIVASNSARRQQLMREAGYMFEVEVLDVDETLDGSIPSKEVAEFLAKKKNQAYRPNFNDEIILTADTVVILDDKILGKPADEEEAYEMILAMSDRTHEVISGVCISDAYRTVSFSDTTVVQFEKLSDQEIHYYIKHYRPFDKAGSYGIQEWLGMIAIRSIQGSYYNVVGLPVHRVYQVLMADFGISPL